tara:strand:- start:318 stop:443 length:126 start_codon:yes stop_codon:yes gene_type:complete
MNRKEFFEWLNTCPSHKWEIITDEFGTTRILFTYEESEDEK